VDSLGKVNIWDREKAWGEMGVLWSRGIESLPRRKGGALTAIS